MTDPAPAEHQENPAQAVLPQLEMAFNLSESAALPEHSDEQAPLVGDELPPAIADDLEEEVLDPTDDTPVYRPGDSIDGHDVCADLGRGWYRVEREGALFALTTRPQAAWAQLAAHRVLPRVHYPGECTAAVEWLNGDALCGPLQVPQALAHLAELARLAFAMERQGYALIDLDPDHLLLVDGTLRLRLPPRIARIGEQAPATYREGFTAPEVQSAAIVQAATSSYLLGALLLHWLPGDAFPVPGVPQLLVQLLAEDPAMRVRPAEVLASLRALLAAPIPEYRVVAATTVGLNETRPVNEDAFGYQQARQASHGAPVTQLEACVADGMGGYAAGEVASAAAVRAFLCASDDAADTRVWQANSAVLNALQGQEGGCAFSGVLIRGDSLTLGHVGDTRTYLARGGQVRQLSQDHSLVAALVASGQISEQEAETHPDRNVILRSLGSLRQPQERYVQTLEEPLALLTGDRVLLVSDGVWGQLSAARLEERLTAPGDPQSVVDALIGDALAAGAPDNATALLIERWM